MRNSQLTVYIELLRPFTLIYPAVAILSGFIISLRALTVFPGISMVILGACTGSLLNGASNVLNQYYDIEIDSINKPFRPLPSKRISRQSALIYSIGLFVLCFFLSLIVNFKFFLFILIASLCTIAYSVPPLRTKNRGIFGNLTLAIARGLLIIPAGYSISYPILIKIDPWALGVILGLFVLGTSSSKDISDVKGDSLYGAITLPVKYGIERTRKIIGISLTFPFLFIPLFIYLGWLRLSTLPLTLVSVWGLYVASLITRFPDKVALEKNHPAWIHMYMMMLVYVIGAAFAYTFGG